MEPQTLFLKIIVIGDSGVGKTSLIQQYCYGFYKTHNAATIGCDFTTKVLTKFMHKTVRIQLWDIAGQEKYKMFSKLYLRGATGCIIVSDITRKETLNAALNWKNLASKCFAEESETQIPIILFQNKVDLIQSDDKILTEGNNEILKEFDKDINFIGSVETSAKENSNIKEGILRLVEEIIKIREKNGKKPEDEWGGEGKKLSFVVSPKLHKKSPCLEENKEPCFGNC